VKTEDAVTKAKVTDKTMSQQKNKKVVLNIGGVSCVNCARAIEKQLSKLNGAIKATVNLAAEKAIVEYNPDVVNQKAIHHHDGRNDGVSSQQTTLDKRKKQIQNASVVA
jgi:copper chaperone CopZ